MLVLPLKLTKICNYNVTYNFFVDDLKLYASGINTVKKQLDLVAGFSKDRNDF